MPGFEVFGKDEQKAINDLFEMNGGILFAHGFDAMRKGVYRVREFEAAFAKRMGTPFAQAVSSGSTALKVALKALGVRPGDEVITQAFTFIATVEAILEVGAVPVIVDIDDTLTMCPGSLESAISERTRAIIPVHMMGAPADMNVIMAIAHKYNLVVLEDNAQGCGGAYRGKLLGTIGHMGAFSLDAGKTIMTGEGGMILTSDEQLFVRARAIHDHGHEYNRGVGRGQEKAMAVGFNYRMTELQGAIGLVQLGKLDMILDQQRKNKKTYMSYLKNLPFAFRRIHDREGELGDAIIFFLETREQAALFAKKMAEKGLGTKNLPDAIYWHFAKHWQHLHDACVIKGATSGKMLQKTADLLERAIALPIMVRMTDEKICENAGSIIRIAKEVA